MFRGVTGFKVSGFGLRAGWLCLRALAFRACAQGLKLGSGEWLRGLHGFGT